MKVFLISLPDSRQRRLSALKNIRISGLPFEIVDGIEAKKMRAECLPIGTTDFPLLPGEIGCYAAHLRALQRIVDYELPWGYVLEDDFCYESDPDYGLVEIAHILPNSFDYIALFRSLGFNERYRRHEESHAFRRLCETEYLTTGYIAHREFAEYVLQHHSLCEMPVDHLYAKLSHSRSCFETISPIIAIAPDLGSDIHGT